jgi:hypothetical protein
MLPSKSARRAARTLCAAFVVMGGSAVACSGDDGVVTGGDPGKNDSGAGNVGGLGGAPAGGSSGSGGGAGASGASAGGNGGAFGAAGAAGNGGNGGGAGVGSGGSGGAAGSGPDASVGGTGGFNTCNASFCPNTGAGTPCCVTGNGPCGMDIGQGCIAGSNPGRDR